MVQSSSLAASSRAVMRRSSASSEISAVKEDSERSRIGVRWPRSRRFVPRYVAGRLASGPGSCTGGVEPDHGTEVRPVTLSAEDAEGGGGAEDADVWKAKEGEDEDEDKDNGYSSRLEYDEEVEEEDEEATEDAE
jgi:hypothetical protein